MLISIAIINQLLFFKIDNFSIDIHVIIYKYITNE